MPLPDNFCSQVSKVFNGQDRSFRCQSETSLFTAQWTPSSTKEYSLPQPVSLFQNPVGNPQGIWLLEWKSKTTQDPPLRMIVTEHRDDRPVYPAGQIMGLQLIEQGLLIQNGEKLLQSPWHKCPSPLELLTTPQLPRLLAGPKLERITNGAWTWKERLLYDGIAKEHRWWIDQIKAAHANENRQLLTTLCVLLNHELMHTCSSRLAGWSDGFFTFSEHGNGRLIYHAANRALQSLRGKE